MKSIFLLLSLFLSSLLYCQKCKFDKDETDPYTKEVFRGQYMKIDGYWKLSIEQRGEEFNLIIGLYFMGDNDFIFQKGSELNILLEDESVINLIANKDSQPVASVSTTGVITSYAPQYSLSKDDLNRMSNKLMVSFRFEFDGQPYTREIKKNAKEIMFISGCFLQ